MHHTERQPSKKYRPSFSPFSSSRGSDRKDGKEEYDDRPRSASPQFCLSPIDEEQGFGTMMTSSWGNSTTLNGNSEIQEEKRVEEVTSRPILTPKAPLWLALVVLTVVTGVSRLDHTGFLFKSLMKVH